MCDEVVIGVLAIDVGNSRIKIGLFEQSTMSGLTRPSGPCSTTDDTRADFKQTRTPDSGRLPQLPKCQRTIAVALDSDIPWPEIRSWRSSSNRSQMMTIIAGSNPDAIARVQSSWPSDFLDQPREISTFADLKLQVDLPEPSRVGIDRLLNAVAANAVRDEQRSAVIVDCGTATTIDLISAQGVFQGGAILPGFQLIASSLHEYTALLPLISLDELAETLERDANSPPSIGKTTRQAIQSGIYWSQVGAVRELLDRVSNEFAIQPQLFLTGGGSHFLFAQFSHAQFEPDLSLQGLVLAANRKA